MTFDELKEDFAENLKGRIAPEEISNLLVLADRKRARIERFISNSKFEPWLNFTIEITYAGPETLRKIILQYIRKRYCMEFL